MTALRVNPAARRGPVAILAAAMVLGCSAAGPSVSPPGSTGSPPSPAASPSPPGGSPGTGGLALRIAADGGFVPPGFIVTRLPQLSVFDHGLAIQPGAVPAIYPGPAVTPLFGHRLAPADLERIRSAARAAGLDGLDRTWTNAAVADVETTVITYVDASGRHVHSFYALGFPPGPAASAEERAAREAASAFIRTVEAIVATTSAAPYDPDAYRIYASIADAPAPTGLPTPNILDWPAELPGLADLEPAPGPFQAGCGVVQGPAAAVFAVLLERATQITRFQHGGEEWTLLIRPLLPDEARTCQPSS